MSADGSIAPAAIGRDGFRFEIRARIKAEFDGKIRMAAEAWCCSEKYLQNLCAGTRRKSGIVIPSAPLASRMGYRRVLVFERISEASTPRHRSLPVQTHVNACASGRCACSSN